jgi:hypothetical protein
MPVDLVVQDKMPLLLLVDGDYQLVMQILAMTMQTLNQNF